MIAKDIARKKDMKPMPKPHLIMSRFRIDGRKITNINITVKIRKITEVAIYGFFGLFL